MRGWCVCLGDEYADQEEAVWEDDAGGWSADTDEAAEASRPPLSAGTRKRIFRVLHLCSGYRRVGDVEWWLRLRADELEMELEVWSLDLAVHPSMDLTDQAFVDYIVNLSRAGFFHAVIVGPPCSTWSRAKFRPGGPRPLRTRSEPWGKPDIAMSSSELSKLKLGSLLLRASLTIIQAV